MAVSFQAAPRITVNTPIVLGQDGKPDPTLTEMLRMLSQQAADYAAGQQDNVNLGNARRLSAELDTTSKSQPGVLPFYLRDRGGVPTDYQQDPEKAEKFAKETLLHIHRLKVPPVDREGRMTLQASVSEADRAAADIGPVADLLRKERGALEPTALEYNGRQQQLQALAALARDRGTEMQPGDSFNRGKDQLLAAKAAAKREKSKKVA